MPPKRNSSNPPKVMTWPKAAPILVIAAIFDLVRIFFEFFWFFGPALTAAYCTLKVSGAAGTTVGGFLCGAAATVAGVAGFAAIEVFGIVMAMAVGLLGWMTIGIFLLRSNPRIFKENADAFLMFAGSLLVSEIPIIGTIPAPTFVLWRLYRMQIHKDKKALQKFEEEQAGSQIQQQQQVAMIMQEQAEKLASAEV